MKKILAFIMAMLMILTCFSALSMGVLAAEGDEVVDDGAGDVNPDEGEGEGEDTPAAPDLSVKYEINFRKYSEDVSSKFFPRTDDPMVFGSLQVDVAKKTDSGYVTISSDATATDPYFILTDVIDITEEFPITNLSYAVIKYRSNAAASAGNMFFNVWCPDGEDEDTNPDVLQGWGGANVTYGVGFVGNSEWQTIVVDLTNLAQLDTAVCVRDIRIDTASAGAGIFDLAYIKFFASAEGANAQVAAEQVSKTVQGEMNEGDARIVETADGVYYSAIDLVALTAKPDAEGVYVDADNNEYTLRGNYVINADGTDTGLSLIKDVDGNAYAYAHLFQLAYIDPASAAVEIEGVKYVYGAKAEATADKVPVAPEGVTPGARPTNVATFTGLVSCDTVYVNDAVLEVPGIGKIDGKVDKYKAIYGSNFYDTAKTLESIGFRGWALNTEAVPDAFGYMINDGEPVWDDSFLKVDTALYGPLNSENPRRYEIMIPTTDLAEGIYAITLLVKYGEDVYCINNDAGSPTQWGELTFVKGGTEKIVSYSVGADVYTFDAENGNALLLNGEAAPASSKLVVTGDTVDTTTAVLYTNLEELGESSTGKYVYDANLSYVATPAVPYNPATLVPSFIIDGADLVTQGTGITAEYNYEEGFVTYSCVTPGDNNAGNLFSGVVVPRYMLVKYRSTNANTDGIFISATAVITADSEIRYAFVNDGNWNYQLIDLAQSVDFVDGEAVVTARNDILNDGSVDVAFYAFFDTVLAAETYIEEELWTAPKYHTATFVDENGDTVKEVMFKEGDTKLIGAPAVPKKDGYKGTWAEYTLGNEDITIAPVYTLKEVATDAPEAETDAPEAGTDAPEAGTDAPEAGTDAPEAGTNAPEAGTNAPEAATDEAGTTAEAGTEAGTKAEAGTTAGTTASTDAAAEEGCSSVVGFGAIAVIMTAAAAAVALKKKED